MGSDKKQVLSSRLHSILHSARSLPHLVHITTVAESLRFLRGQPDSLRNRGFHVEAITSPGPLVEPMSEELGISIHTVEMPRKITPLRDLLALYKTTELLRALSPDIVHAHTPKGGLLGVIAASLAGVPIRFYHMRGLPMETATGWKYHLLRTTETISCALAHQVIAVGHSLRHTAIDAAVCPPDKICVLANGSGQGVDAKERFNPERFDARHREVLRNQLGIPLDATVVGFVGRLVADKGINELTEAWQRLRNRYADAHLVLIGPFEERDPVPNSTRQILEEDSQTHLLGTRDDVDALYCIMDVLVLPTHREGFPNVPLEAAAMELPVVASDIPACLEAVQANETGLHFATGDAQALARTLSRYLDDPDLRRRHGRAGRKRAVESFAPHLIQGELAALYDQWTKIN